MGFPRQLGQHTGGFVITDNKLSDLCPVMNARMENRTQLEWNKDDLEALGILKVDVLGLGMLTMIRKAFDLVEHHYGKKLTLANVPQALGTIRALLLQVNLANKVEDKDKLTKELKALIKALPGKG